MGRSPLVILLGLASGACGDTTGDAKVPGEPLGRFAITGTLSEDECRATVLGVVDPWSFELRLSRLHDDLYWLNGREAIAGRLGSDERSFEFDTQVDWVFEAPRGTKPGCTIARRDLAGGKLHPNAAEPERLSAEIAFIYDVRSGSDCSDIVGVSGGFSRLPCRVTFDLSGTLLSDAER